MDEHIALAKANLAHAKAQYEAAQVLYRSALRLQEEVQQASLQREDSATSRAARHESTNANSTVLLEQTAVSNEAPDVESAVSLCEECADLAWLEYFLGRKSPRYKRVAIGDLTSTVKKARTCALCRFVVDSLNLTPGLCLPDGNDGAGPVNDAIRDQVTVVKGKPLWTTIAGCDLNIDPNAFAWLELDSASRVVAEKRAPWICISWHPNRVQASRSFEIAGPRLRSIHEQSEGLVDYDLITSWLKICTIRHGAKCEIEVCTGEGSDSTIPVYLIDLQTRNVVSAPKGTRYVAVSYVWGADQSSQNSDGPYAREGDRKVIAIDGKRQIPTVLPQTLEDALVLTAAIGERYVWIDKYCIDQNNQEQVKEQIANMDTIYRQAWLTLIALASPNADSGIAGVSRSMKGRRQPTLVLPDGRLVATSIENSREQYGYFPWDERAWTLQEFVLSRRCLMFSDCHVSLLCQEELFHDTLPASCPDNLHIWSDETESKLDNTYWWDTVFDIKLNGIEWDFKVFDGFIAIFSGRHIRYQSEILNASKGCFNHITQRTGMTFTFGLPVGDLIRALLWKAKNSVCLIRRSWCDDESLVPKSFPSWSWAGWQGAAECDYWIGDMAGYIDQKETEGINVLNRKRRKRPRPDGAAPVEPSESHKALIVHYPDTDDVNHPQLRIFSLVARCKLECVRKNGERYEILKNGAKRSMTSVGDHWTLLEAGTDYRRRDIAGNDVVFASRDYFFRTDGSVSEKIREANYMAELLMISHWPLVRDSADSGTWLQDMVSCLVILRNDDCSAWRIAAILLEEEIWNQYDPLPVEIDLV